MLLPGFFASDSDSHTGLQLSYQLGLQSLQGWTGGGIPSKLTHLNVDGTHFLLGLVSQVLGGCWQETCLNASLCSLPYMTARTVVPVSMRARKRESKPQRTSGKEARHFLIFYRFGVAVLGLHRHVQAFSSCSGDNSSFRFSDCSSF